MAKKSSKKEIKVVNIVVSTSLEHDVPLEKMAATLSNTERLVNKAPLWNNMPILRRALYKFVRDNS